MKFIVSLLLLICLAFVKSQDPVGPSLYNVLLSTTKGDIQIQVNRTLSPYGSDRFYALVSSGFFDNTAYFRVIREPQSQNFVAQTGISGTPELNIKWNVTIPNDPVLASNIEGTVTFAAEESETGTCCRTTQIFINYANNSFLDKMGFSPFGMITSGFENALNFYGGYGEDPDQTLIYEDGNSYLQKNYPLLDYTNTATIISEKW